MSTESRCSILVVNDDDGGRYISARALANAGFMVREAASGTAAIEQISMQAPDAVLLDVRLPDVDGVTLCRRIKSSIDNLPPVIVLISAYWDDEMQKRIAVSAGADACVTAEIPPLDIVALMSALLRARRLADELERTNRALNEQLNKFETLLRVVPVGIMVAEDPSCTRMRGNPAFEAMLGVASAANASKSAPPEEQPSFRVFAEGREVTPSEMPIQRCVLTGAPVHSAELEILRADGRLVHIFGDAAPLFDQNGAVYGSVGAFVDITERRRTERQLQASEERFRRLAETATVGVLMGDMRGGLHYANSAAAELLGYTAEEVSAGHARWDELTPAEFARVDGQAMEQLRTKGRADPYEKAHVRKDGARVPVLIGLSRIGVLHDGQPQIAAFITDLRPLKSAQEALRLAEERLRLATDAAEIGTWDFDPAAVAFVLSDTTRKILDAPVAVLPYGAFLSRVHPVDLPAVEEAWKQALRGLQFKSEFRVVVADRVRWIASRGKAVFATDALTASATRLLGTMMDVTDQKSAEEQLHRAITARDEIVAIVSHDLRSPLTAITVAAALLEHDEFPSAEAAEHLTALHSSTATMSALVRGLLDVAAVEGGGVSIDPAPVDVGGVVQRTCATHQMMASAKEVTLSTEIAPELPLALVDESRLVQVLDNLLSNAVKFTSAGNRIEVSVKSSPDAVEIAIADGGCGISSEAMPHVFDRFWQATRNNRAGAGLGLAIAKGIVEAHGGRLEVKSEGKGKGATFRATFPVMRPEERTPADLHP